MPDIFDEVSEDLRAERAQRLLRRYGWVLVVVAVLIVIAAGGWQFWRQQQAQSRAAIAGAFMTASSKVAAPAAAESSARTEAEKTFADMAADGPTGYRTLARLREAALKAGSDPQAARALWDKVSADETADPQLRRLADLLWVQHQVDAGEPATVEGRLAPLLAEGNPWRPLALECQALLKLRTGDTPAAIAILRDIAVQPTTPNGLRARASGLLLRLGAPEPAAAAEKQG